MGNIISVNLMNPEKTPLKELFEASIQFQIPIYQRTYDWTKENVRQLYDDIMDAGKAQKDRYHFIGAITLVNLPKPIRDNITRHQLIDGQQRITSLMLLLRALLDKVDDSTSVTKPLIEKMLFNDTEKQDSPDYFKMVLHDDDEPAFREIMKTGSTMESGSIATNFKYIVNLLKNEDADSVWYGVKSLTAVVIPIGDKDDAQAIFESMNSTGLDLTEADMIQNYMLMANDPKWQKRIYQSYWRPMEQLLGGGGGSEFNEFLRSYTIMVMEKNVTKQTVYREFKVYMKHHDRESEIKEIYMYSKYYAQIIGIAKDPKHELESQIRNIREQDTSIANPLLLKIMADYDRKKVSKTDAMDVIRLVDSYLVRSYVCGTLKGGNKVFPGLIKEMDGENYAKNVEQALMSKTGSRLFPRDVAFRDQLERFRLYLGKEVCKYILTRLEHGHGNEKMDPEALQIEHIMPQKLTDGWKKDLGKNWADTHDKYLHTIGNLTLTADNQPMSNSQFSIKLKTYKNSRIKITPKPNNYTAWGEDEIRDRAKALSGRAIEIWKCPKEYGHDDVEDDPEEEYLEKTNMADIWHKLKKRIHDACPNIQFHMTKVYGTFGYPSNGMMKKVGICALEARNNKIYLTYNTKISDCVIKPSGLVRDVSSVGHHPVGDLRATIMSEDDIEEATKLVKIVLEHKVSKQNIY